MRKKERKPMLSETTRRQEQKNTRITKLADEHKEPYVTFPYIPPRKKARHGLDKYINFKGKVMKSNRTMCLTFMSCIQ